MKMTDLIRVSTAAKQIGVTSQYIYTLIEKKRLTPVEIDEVVFVNKNEVSEFQADRERKKALRSD